jgi:hypothetical protein
MYGAIILAILAAVEVIPSVTTLILVGVISTVQMYTEAKEAEAPNFPIVERVVMSQNNAEIEGRNREYMAWPVSFDEVCMLPGWGTQQL